MEKKVESVEQDIFETTQVKIGSEIVEVVKYVAFDGKEFANEDKCADYEELKKISNRYSAIRWKNSMIDGTLYLCKDQEDYDALLFAYNSPSETISENIDGITFPSWINVYTKYNYNSNDEHIFVSESVFEKLIEEFKDKK